MTLFDLIVNSVHYRNYFSLFKYNNNKIKFETYLVQFRYFTTKIWQRRLKILILLQIYCVMSQLRTNIYVTIITEEYRNDFELSGPHT